jgi:hypothetical protein
MIDGCGTCDSDPSNDCPTDCGGVPGGAELYDACGNCDGDPSNDCNVIGTLALGGFGSAGLEVHNDRAYIYQRRWVVTETVPGFTEAKLTSFYTVANVSDVTTPVEIETLDADGRVRDMGFAHDSNIAYQAHTPFGLTVHFLNVDGNPVSETGYPPVGNSQPFDIENAPSGEYYATTAVHLRERANDDPNTVIATALFSQIQAANDTDNNAHIEFIDVCDPYRDDCYNAASGVNLLADPATVGQLALPGASAWDIIYQGNYVYVANGSAGLTVVQMASDGTSASIVAEVALTVPDTVSLDPFATALDIQGDMLVVTAGSTIEVYDITNPADPASVAVFETTWSKDVSIHTRTVAGQTQRRIYMADNWAGIRVYEASDINEVSEIGVLYLPDNSAASGLVVPNEGNTAYVTTMDYFFTVQLGF